MLSLDRVTLCCIDCVNQELALAAIAQTLHKCNFARAIFITDQHYDLDGVEVIRVNSLNTREAYSHFVIKELSSHISSDFVLLIQWDGFVINPAAWREEFLSYDYIGARWGWYRDGFTVGNGGFSLRSKRLLKALRDAYIAEYPLEDHAICRTYRPYLETQHGIRFAPEQLADAFAFEASYPSGLPFGFHGLFNFWLFFQKDDLAVFLDIATPDILASVQCTQLAQNYADVQRLDEALMILSKIVAVHPGHVEAATLLRSLASATSKSIGRNDPCPCGSGKRYKECHGRLGAPSASVNNSAADRPGKLTALLQRALSAHQEGDLYAAEAIYQQALSLDPANAIAQHYLGVIAYQQHRYEEARDMLQLALQGNEHLPDFHNNLGLVLHRLGDLPGAISRFERALALNPDYLEAHNNLGMALQDERRYEEAMAHFNHALSLRPDFAEGHWNRALLHLLQENYQSGWEEYEWRLLHPQLGLPYERRFAKPRWDGSRPDGKTLLIYCEQGFGDALQFVRYAALLRERGAKVVLEAPSALRRLFASIREIDVVEPGTALSDFDLYAPLLSLPLAFQTNATSIPATVPYLFASPFEVAHWQTRLAEDGAFRIGLVWAGNLKNIPLRHRACPAERFSALAQVKSVSFYSLQKDRPAELRGPSLPLIDYTGELPDFAATAALVANLDLVITIDTALAHLAGALGKRVWVLLPYERDWRWLVEPDTSPWYPTMRLFRQEQRGDWETVLDKVVAALRQLLPANS